MMTLPGRHSIRMCSTAALRSRKAARSQRQERTLVAAKSARVVQSKTKNKTCKCSTGATVRECKMRG
eukprot:6213494-Pleurochrysis_carterae.AAC.2